MILSQSGKKINITRQYPLQHELEDQYRRNGKHLPLSLVFDDPRDFMAVVSYYAGNC